MCHSPLRITSDGGESVRGKKADFAIFDNATVVFCDQSGDHTVHHQYFERVDGTVVSVAWADELDRNTLVEEHGRLRGKVLLDLPRLPGAKKAFPSPKSKSQPKVKLVREKVSAEDW